MGGLKKHAPHTDIQHVHVHVAGQHGYLAGEGRACRASPFVHKLAILANSLCAETNYSFEIRLTKPEIASKSPSAGSSLSDYLRPRCQEVCGLQPDRGMVTRWQTKVREKPGLRMRNPGKAGIRVPR